MSILSRYRTALTRIQHPLPPAVSAEQAGRDENNESLLEIENRRNDQRESVSSRTRREDGEDGEKDVRRHRRQRMITKTYQPIDEPGEKHFSIPSWFLFFFLFFYFFIYLFIFFSVSRRGQMHKYGE